MGIPHQLQQQEVACYGLGFWGLGFFSPSFKQSIAQVLRDARQVGPPDLSLLCCPQSPPSLSPPAPCKVPLGTCQHNTRLSARALRLSPGLVGQVAKHIPELVPSLSPSFSLANLNEQRPAPATSSSSAEM